MVGSGTTWQSVALGAGSPVLTGAVWVVWAVVVGAVCGAPASVGVWFVRARDVTGALRVGASTATVVACGTLVLLILVGTLGAASVAVIATASTVGSAAVAPRLARRLAPGRPPSLATAGTPSLVQH